MTCPATVNPAVEALL